MRPLTGPRVAVVGLALAAGLAVAPAARATGGTGHTIHPGVSVSASGNVCEAGLLLRQRHRVFVGVPASCLGTDNGGKADGCTEAQIPYGSDVTIGGARHKGRVVYSSFSTMQLRGMSGGDACQSNDLGLVKLAAGDVRRATPVIPTIGRPTGPSHRPPPKGTTLQTYLNGARQSAKAGSTTADGWQHAVTVAGSLDQSNVGAPMVTSAGRVVGMLSLLPTVPRVGASQAMDLARELRFLRTVRGFHHVHLLHHAM